MTYMGLRNKILNTSHLDCSISSRHTPALVEKPFILYFMLFRKLHYYLYDIQGDQTQVGTVANSFIIEDTKYFSAD